MRILLVEDNLLIGGPLQHRLRRKGFVVDWAIDGASALLVLRTTPYGLVLLDLALAGGDALTLLAGLRHRNDPTPVLVITPRNTGADQAASQDSVADDCLVKPFALNELLASIRVEGLQQMRRLETTLHVGALWLDSAQCRVWLRDHEVPVTKQESALLRELMRDPTSVVTHEQLGQRLEMMTNAVQVHVHNLRRKLGVDTIRNVRGVGYRIGDIA
ncbi:response regulator [Paraburkholderia sp. Tr-20389]|uniref:response regulator n=1 Tax=Paraburkholderia sp. Tr-20389 TaxID=2703903 RepID=UPI0019806B63|nr:response regulator [Paraburkholderia sp. Tr-20389]MBN3756244.1 response regulator [Paraburkholderia sp. Tr-20389]